MTATNEQRVLRWLERELEAYPLAGPSGKSIMIEDIHLEKGELEGEDIVILFREAERPHCLCGFRVFVSPIQPEHQWKEDEDPEGQAPSGHRTVIYVNLMEHIQAADMGLPDECVPDGITWI